MPLIEGLVQVYTGDGKGKTSAGVGAAVRALGSGLRVAFIQFVKGGKESSELEPLRSLGALVVRPADRSTGLLAEGATEEDHSAAAEAWRAASEAIGSGDFDVVVCDELNVAIAAGLVPLTDVIEALEARPRSVEVVLTGRNAPAEIREAADYVSWIRAEKHPFDRGVKARRGIEF
ncbi:MAG: cob(I)yrinic acid a,c-diamide adenosyltransferase [Coriobacteriales bacterium]|nr:cob(I)yrinic acid a,c-diamide adenosyltransferase [Coriobacteriales bacterium]